jgi:hypothetical protein
MITLSPLAKKLSGYLLVGPTWALALFLSAFEKDGVPRSVPLTLYILGYLIIAVVTFDWGRMRGFPAKIEDGRYSGTNILRCLVMTCIMTIPVGFVALPFMLIALRIIR